MFLHVQCQEYLQDGENWVTRNYDECLAWILSEAHLRCAMRKGFLSCRHNVAAIVGGHCVRKGFGGLCVK